MSAELEPLRFSRLKHMAKSAAHYLANPSDESASLRKGSAVHSYLLGAEDAVAVYEDGARNPRYKKYQDFLAANEGKLILSPSEFAHADGMRRSILAHPRARMLLGGRGIREQRITWTMSGRECAGTPDVVHLDLGGKRVLVELKTSKSAAPDLFKWQGRKLHYPSQVSWYKSGLEGTLMYPPAPVDEAFVVAVESSPPYPVVVLRMTPKMLQRGDRIWRPWFEYLLVCERSGHFPAYAEGDVEWDDEEADEAELEWDDEDEVAA